MSETSKETPSATPRGRIRCILIHGFNGEPVDMYELEQHLHARRIAATNMLLPGHGTSARDFAQSRWEHWIEAVRGETLRAMARGERVILVGHSMGGALSLATAASVAGVAGVAALCAPVRLDSSRRDAIARAHRWLPYVPTFGEDVRDWLGARRRYERKAYRWTPLATAHSLFQALPEVRQMLPAVTCPTLLIYARHDHVVPFRDGLEAYKLLGAREKELVTLSRSFHTVTKDVERQAVCERVAVFCERVRVSAVALGETSRDGAAEAGGTERDRARLAGSDAGRQ